MALSISTQNPGVAPAPKENYRSDFLELETGRYTRFTGEFWTSRQRQANRLHEISYRACFKPQLAAFFIRNYSRVGDKVYDPFAGRGTALIEAAFLGRRPVGNDINPLSQILCMPRLNPPRLEEVAARLDEIDLSGGDDCDIDLTMFFHPKTLAEIMGLRAYLISKETDFIDNWIRMVATNRLTGHSPGFFSVYTLPPNQAASPERQLAINAKLKQKPEYKDIRAIILKKSKSLLSGLGPVERQNLKGSRPAFHIGDAGATQSIRANSIGLVVTSPPFVNIVQYSDDNWLRAWFNDLPADNLKASLGEMRTLDGWKVKMAGVLKELTRVLRPDGHVAFEVGEIKNGKHRLDEEIIPLGEKWGLQCRSVFINSQSFTKTANIWGIANNKRGTNTNRIVLFQKAV